jgi:hypothetical protein
MNAFFPPAMEVSKEVWVYCSFILEPRFTLTGIVLLSRDRHSCDTPLVPSSPVYLEQEIPRLEPILRSSRRKAEESPTAMAPRAPME